MQNSGRVGVAFIRDERTKKILAHVYSEDDRLRGWELIAADDFADLAGEGMFFAWVADSEGLARRIPEKLRQRVRGGG